MKTWIVTIAALVTVAVGCSSDESDLQPALDRANASVSSLQAELDAARSDLADVAAERDEAVAALETAAAQPPSTTADTAPSTTVESSTTVEATTSSTPPPSTTGAPTTDAPTTTVKHSGNKQPADCAEGQVFTDNDGDGWGSCFAPPPPPLTTEDITALLNQPAHDWIVAPSAPGFDAIAAAAQQLVNSNRDMPADTQQALEHLVAYPGSDLAVADALQVLRYALPSLPPILSDGVYTVGRDVAPGRYRTLNPVRSCYWETLDSSGEINDNNFIDAAPQAQLTVRPADYAVNIDGCGRWVKID